MAWFRKEKKPRLPRHEKHEIPPDAWEKCDRCGHTDLREKFVRNLNVCPSCGFHRRIRASEYAAILLDETPEASGAMTRIGIFGASGRMGRAIADAAAQVGVAVASALWRARPARCPEPGARDGEALLLLHDAIAR